MIDEDQLLGSVRDRLLERYLDFRAGGLHLVVRDISAEIAEARKRLVEHLGREPQWPRRPSRLIHLWVVSDASGEIVGNATREVGLRGAALVVAHKQLRLAPQWRRRGFGSALLEANREWYRACGVESIVMEAEGDGSAFAAVRGFDFDLTAYAGRPGCGDLSERELRLNAVDRLIHHAPIQEPGGGGDGPPRQSVTDFLDGLRDHGTVITRQVEGFRRRLPQPAHSDRDGLSADRGTLTGDASTFTTPQEIATFGESGPLEGLDGASLGPAVLALTGWSALSVLSPAR